MDEKPYIPVNENVTWISRFVLKKGASLEKFKGIMRGFIDSVDKNEPGALTYSWFLSPDETYVSVIQRFSTHEAAYAHLTGECVTKWYPLILEITDNDFTYYGTPSEKNAALFNSIGLNPTGHKHIGGIQR
jgi:quinol monooxygenase YgiN